MANVKNVITGLKCCKEAIGITDQICGKCPYKEYVADCVSVLVADAFELLKAQEPRVMTLAELEHAEVVYAEDKDKAEIIPVLVNGRHYDHFTMIKARSGGTMHVFRPSIFDYGKRWRCWTSRPDKKRMEATPWDEQSQRDYEATVKMAEYCERYEPTYNVDDGSM